MPARLVWSPAARDDLVSLYVEIGIEQPEAAERYFQRIEYRAGLLVEHPRMGVRRRDIRPSARMLVEAPYLILYETVPDTGTGPVQTVEVIRVVNGRLDVRDLF